MYLTFTYDGKLNEDVQYFTEICDYMIRQTYTVKLSDIVCKSIYNENYLTIKILMRNSKIFKLINKKMVNDYIFLNFYINNIDKISILKINDNN